MYPGTLVSGFANISVYFNKLVNNFKPLDGFFKRIKILLDGISIWNSIPYSVKSLSKYKFRNKIKQILLETLERENDNIEVSIDQLLYI